MEERITPLGDGLYHLSADGNARQKDDKHEFVDYKRAVNEEEAYAWEHSFLKRTIYTKECRRVSRDFDGLQQPGWVREVWNAVHKDGYRYTIHLVFDYDISPNHDEGKDGDAILTKVLDRYMSDGFTPVRYAINPKNATVFLHSKHTSRNISVVIKWEAIEE